jgi:hypothetical protein
LIAIVITPQRTFKLAPWASGVLAFLLALPAAAQKKGAALPSARPEVDALVVRMVQKELSAHGSSA